jgi:dihydrodipicolinate synthase/N-acetylneuraminate lyase
MANRTMVDNRSRAQKINGVVPVIPIPFHADESIDEKSLRRCVEFVCSRGMAGMCLPAYASEFYKLSEAERETVIGIAIEANDKRIPVIAQANHGSAKIAAGLARRYEAMGADVISFALPRQFGSTDADLLRYCGTIADAVSIPVLIQDFAPGKATIDADFIDDLHKQHPNFLYAKLEEPMIIDKLVRIQEKVGEKVGIFEGWGGYYMLEAIPVGIVGIIPGVPYCDLLNIVYQARKAGDDQRAYDLFAALLPMMNFTLQDFELFLQVEKRLLVRRGIFDAAHMRQLTMTPSKAVMRHAEFLIEQMMLILAREGVELRVGVESCDG